MSHNEILVVIFAISPSALMIMVIISLSESRDIVRGFLLLQISRLCHSRSKTSQKSSTSQNTLVIGTGTLWLAIYGLQPKDNLKVPLSFLHRTHVTAFLLRYFI